MLVGAVVRHPVEQQPHPACVDAVDQCVEVGIGAEDRIDAAVIGDVVAEIADRRGEDRREPQRVDTEIGEVVQPARDAGQVADAVAVRVGERPRVDLVDDRVTPPRASPGAHVAAPPVEVRWSPCEVHAGESDARWPSAARCPVRARVHTAEIGAEHGIPTVASCAADRSPTGTRDRRRRPVHRDRRHRPARAARDWRRRGGGPSRRSATPTPGRPLRSGWCRRAPTRGRTRPATACYDLITEGVPPPLFDRLVGVGLHPLPAVGHRGDPQVLQLLARHADARAARRPRHPLAAPDEVAEPGYYAATLANGIRCELTVGPKSAVHRYTFPAHGDARLVVDFSLGGLAIEHGRTVPLRARLGVDRARRRARRDRRRGRTARRPPRVRHTDLASDALVRPAPDAGWHPARLRLDPRRRRCGPFGLILRGPTEPGQAVELRLGFSLRGVEQARANLLADCGPEPATASSARRARRRERRGREHLDTIRVETASSARRTIFATALYHSLIKPCFAPDESPFWPASGPFVFDICHDVGHLPHPAPADHAARPRASGRVGDGAAAHLRGGGQPADRLPDGPWRRPVLPPGQRPRPHLPRRPRRPRASPDIDWDWALVHMHDDLRRNYGEEFLERGVAHPITHTLDLAFGYHCTAVVARHVGDDELAAQFETLATRWVDAFDPETGLLVDSTFYEGGRWNYSFRLSTTWPRASTSPAARTRSSSCSTGSSASASRPVKQLGVAPDARVGRGRATRSNRFEGLNNEPDMEAPWAYHYVGRPDRTAEVVHAVIENQFAHRPRRSARQRRLRRAQLVVRVGVARPVPRRRSADRVRATPRRSRARRMPRPAGHVRDRDHRLRRARTRPTAAVRPGASRSTAMELDRTWITTAELARRRRLARPPRTGRRLRRRGATSRPPSTCDPPTRMSRPVDVDRPPTHPTGACHRRPRRSR